MFLAAILLALTQLQLPAQFDLRDVGGENFVTSVKNQQGGTCWTHGTMASMESNMLITGEWENSGETGEPALAEYHLDWWNGFNDWYNADMDPPSGSGGLTVHMGGDYLVATAYLSRGEGAVREIDGQSYDVAPPRSSPEFHRYYPADVEWHLAGDELSSLDRIKSALMEHGGIACCYYSSSSYMVDFIHYQPPSTTELPNHAVTIVGWDDNKVTQAPEPGAWICKNSWGENWGFDGYFYISYWDKWCTREPFMGTVSFTNTQFMEYEKFYYHDYHGWRDTFSGIGKVMNAFEATGDHYITSASFFTATDSVDFTASFYGSFQGGTLTDLISTESGFLQFRGLHTAELSNPFEIAQGDSVYFVMEFSEGGYPYDRTAEVPVLLGASMRVIVESSASPGESYYYDGSWHDLYSWPENPYPGTANFCLKMLGFNAGIRISPDQGFVFQGEVGGPFSPASETWEMEYMGSETVQYQVTCESVNWLELIGPVSGNISPGETIDITASLTGEAASLPLGVYTALVQFTNITSGTGNTEQSVVLIVGEAGIIYSWNMESDPGWTSDGLWAWGVPLGLGGAHGHPDPTAGFTGENVYGYNLMGDYEPSSSEKYLTTGSIDCSNLYGTQLRFQRWLGVEGNAYDHASVRISTDQETWFSVWENGEEEITESSWSTAFIDISSIADDEPNIWIRWVMGTTDPGWEYCGWNLDDVEIWATGALSVEEGEEAGALSVRLTGANPSLSSTAFTCGIPAGGFLVLNVHDLSGRVVNTVYSGTVPGGDITIPYNLTDASGRRLPAGMYPVMATCNGQTAVTRMVVINR
jgi:C1A family cysteine protease